MEMEFMSKQLQGLYSWITLRQEGSKLMGHCSICARHKDELPTVPGKAWCLPYGVELLEFNTYTDATWRKVKDKAYNHSRRASHIQLSQ